MQTFNASDSLARELTDTLFGGVAPNGESVIDAILETSPDFPIEKGDDEYERIQREVWDTLTGCAEFPF